MHVSDLRLDYSAQLGIELSTVHVQSTHTVLSHLDRASLWRIMVNRFNVNTFHTVDGLPVWFPDILFKLQ